MRIFLRLACCAWLVFYVIVPNLRPQPEGETIDPALRIITVVFFIAATAFILVITFTEYMRNKKAGKYNADAYEDDPDPESTPESTIEEESAKEADNDEEEV